MLQILNLNLFLIKIYKMKLQKIDKEVPMFQEMKF